MVTARQITFEKIRRPFAHAFRTGKLVYRMRKNEPGTSTIKALFQGIKAGSIAPFYSVRREARRAYTKYGGGKKGTAAAIGAGLWYGIKATTSGTLRAIRDVAKEAGKAYKSGKKREYGVS
jgi:hypothetical protein